MKQDESKTTAAAQPESDQSVATVETPDTQSPSGTTVEGPADAPHDGEGCEAVIVVIVESSEQRALLAARSVKQNLVGVDALVVRLGMQDGCTLPQALYRLLTEGTSQERIVLMTDQMLLLNPMPLAMIAVPKAVKVGTNEQGEDILDYNVRMPQLMHRSVLLPMLEEIIEQYPYTDIFEAYTPGAYPQVRPILLPRWDQERWLLPIVSVNPPMKAVETWAKTQMFAWIAAQSWSKPVISFLEKCFAE